MLLGTDAFRSFAVAFAVIVAVVAASCDKVPLTSPTGSTIQLSASSNIVPVDGSAEITATVIESAGTAVQNGTTVTFRADLGRMDPPEAQTVNGRAISRYFASGLSGVARINAYSGAASTGGSAPTNSSAPAPSTALTLLVGGAAASRIALRAEPPNIPQTGGTIQIIANVSDSNGAPVMGAPVTFTIASGGTGGTTGNGILGSPSTQTNASGVAQTSLTTNQTTTVTARVATAGAASDVTANVVVTALAAPSVAITGCTTAQAVGVPVTCTITPTVPSGGAPIQNLTINWGDNTGEQPLGGTGTTSASHTYTAPGTYTITAAATDLNSQRGTATQAVVVSRVLPTGTLDVPATGTAGVPVAMSYTPSSTAAQPTTSVSISFGDGTSRTFSPVNGTVGFTKTYSSEGGYTVTATPTDASGQQGQVSKAIVISRGGQPSVTLTLNSSPAQVGQVESFTVTASAASGGASVQNVRVTIDGVADPVYDRSSSGSFTYVFPAVNNYTMRATVTDAAGNVGNVILIVNVVP